MIIEVARQSSVFFDDDDFDADDSSSAEDAVNENGDGASTWKGHGENMRGNGGLGVLGAGDLDDDEDGSAIEEDSDEDGEEFRRKASDPTL